MSKKELENKLAVVDGEVMGKVNKNVVKTAEEIFSDIFSFAQCNYITGIAVLRLDDLSLLSSKYGVEFIKI